jgi:O-antigen ligase
VARWEVNAPRWVAALPLVWLGWQFLAATQTVDAQLTRGTLKHFAACAGCFYLGFFSLGRRASPFPFWAGLLCGFLIVLAVGVNQHFGGLEETRRYFYTYVYPQSPTVPPEFLKRLSGDRIFSTLVYPNALAGVVLLLLPPILVVVWQMCRQFQAAWQRFLVGLIGFGALACLYWSGSKAGWLLLLLLTGLVVLLHLPFRRQIKAIVVGAVLGLAGFFWKYSGFFQRGATSVGARFDYWRAALQTTAAKPVFGTGPGTFAVAYKKIKKPQSEMTRLTHNDYLQQASDSGIVGCAAYLLFIFGVLFCTYPRNGFGRESLQFSVWLGLLGLSLQSTVEFGLYIPALSWTAFGLMGWLLAVSGKRFDKPEPTR